MKKFFGILIGIVLVVVIAGTLVFLYRKSQRKPVVYATATATRADIVQKTVATGSVVPREEVAIKPLVSGIVDELYIEEGEIVAKGVQVAKVRVIPDMARLSDAESRVNRAEIALADARRNLHRQQQLFDEGTVPRSDLDAAEVAAADAIEELAAAKSTLDIVRTGTSSRVAKAATTVVRATIGGMVLEVPVKVGNSVIEANNFNEGTTIATIADMGDMIFEGKVDESRGRQDPGRHGARAHRRRAAGGEDPRHSRAHRPQGRRGGRRHPVRDPAAVEPMDGALLRANYSANADIVLDKREDVLAIDEGLLQFDGEQPFVEVEVGPQQFERREVSSDCPTASGSRCSRACRRTTRSRTRIPSWRRGARAPPAAGHAARAERAAAGRVPPRGVFGGPATARYPGPVRAPLRCACAGTTGSSIPHHEEGACDVGEP
jgi:HlyD family secretion protein